MTGKRTVRSGCATEAKSGVAVLRHYKANGGGEMFVARNDGQKKSGPESFGAARSYNQFV